MDLNDPSLDTVRDLMPDAYEAMDEQDERDAAIAHELATGRAARP